VSSPAALCVYITRAAAHPTLEENRKQSCLYRTVFKKKHLMMANAGRNM
jgi:hypothetical protein